MRWSVILPAFTCWLFATTIALAQTEAIQKAVDQQLAKKAADELRSASAEALIAEALKNNADIRVAEAKLREMEAELARTRLKVATDISALHAELHAAQAGEKEAMERYERAQMLYRKNPPAISKEELGAASLTYQKLKAERAALEAKLPYLLGRQPGARGAFADDLIRKKWLALGESKAISDEEFLRRVMLDLLGRLPTPEETKDYLKLPEKDRHEKWLEQLLKKEPPPQLYVIDVETVKLWNVPLQSKSQSPMHEKLRKALDAPAAIKTGELAPGEIFEILRKELLQGVNVLVRLKNVNNKKVKISFDAPVPVGAVIQYLEDELDCVFVLRDYGIVVVGNMDRRPPDAIPLRDFWKRGLPPGGPTPHKAK